MLGRMVAEAGLAVTDDEIIDERMAFPSIEEAVQTAIPEVHWPACASTASMTTNGATSAGS